MDDLNGLQSGFIRIGTFSSVATHWLPNIISAFQDDYPGIDYELLIGDYSEIAEWITTGRVDCGFLIEPADPGFETIPLERDDLLAVLPRDHRLAKYDTVPLSSMCIDPFMLLQKGDRSEVAELFENNGLHPNIHLTLWDDYAVMSMVEKELGISILPRLILKRAPYDIAVRELDVPSYRDIVLAFRDSGSSSLAMRRFIEYLDQR